MASMLYAMGKWIARARWYVVIGWVLLLALLGGLAVAFGQGTDDSFAIPGTQSQEALDALSETFPQTSGASAQLVVVAAPHHEITEPAYRAAIGAAVTRISGQHEVAAVTSPYSASGGLISDDGTAGIVSIQMTKSQTEVTTGAEDQLRSAARSLQTALPSGSDSKLGGSLFSGGVPGVSATDAIGLIVAIVVLLITFGSFLAAGMPLLSAILGVGVSVTGILFATVFGPVSSTTPLLAVMLGLAVGIDYALFIISRHIEQLKRGMDPLESLARSVATAGSAVVFAGLTVVIALLGLSVARIPFLTTMGIGAAAAVAVAVLAALTFVPALLSFAGGRLVRKPRRTKRRAVVESVESVETPDAAPDSASNAVPAAGPDALPNAGARAARPNRFFLGWVRLATRWPVVTVVVIAAALGLAALPATHLRLDLGDAGQLAKSDPARQSYDLISEHFGPGFNGPLIVTGTIVTSNDPVKLMDDIAGEIRKLPDVASVPLATPNQAGDTGIVQVIPKSGPSSEKTAELVNRLRGLHSHFQDEYGVSLSVTGFTAVGIDVSDRLGGALLPFGALVVGLSLILLAMVFRSIAIPIKATVGYLFSVVAALGAVSAVFESGVLAGPLNVASTGPVISFMPIILMGVLFGLAMDYEVFLVSRMREEYVHHHNARAAIENGFLGSAKVVTAAAVIMFAVFAAFVPDSDNTIKPIAVGLAVGVFVDAFLIRMTLVPAVLALLGDRAWRLPRWLDRVLPRFDVEGEGLEHELSLANWPESGDDAVAAEGLVIGAADAPIVAGAELRVPLGGTAVIASDDAVAARATLLALTGRTRIESGKAKVLGYALPERAGAIRRRSAYLDVSDVADAETQLQLARRSAVRLLAVDGLDRLAPPQAERLAAAIRELRASASVAGRPLTVLLATVDPEPVERLLPDARRISVPSVSDPSSLVEALA